jgi:hypothetical protein
MLAPLEIELLARGIQPLYAFYRREGGVLRHAEAERPRLRNVFIPCGYRSSERFDGDGR